MKKFITLSKFNGPNPATQIHVNPEKITAVEKTPGAGPPTTTIWGVVLDSGRPLEVAETPGHVLQLIAGV